MLLVKSFKMNAMSCLSPGSVFNLPSKAAPCQWSDVLNAPVLSQAVTVVYLLAVLMAEVWARREEGHFAVTDLACS